MMKNILLLGASGSIGTQTIDIIKAHPDCLCLKGAAVGDNVEYLKTLLEQFDLGFVYSKCACPDLEQKHPDVRFYHGQDGLTAIVKEEGYNFLVNALVGFVGFLPTLKAIEAGKDIALANKETLVAGGEFINEALKKHNVKLYPIDSEHSAIAQCLQGHNKKDVRRLIITASGGAFRDLERHELKEVTVEKALNHPVWAMGSKITIDSATMMNKCFEIMEAHYLFDLPYEQIDVLLHRESIIHSFVEYQDGTLMAQMGNPDMHLPIKYALLYPRNLNDHLSQYLDLDTLTSLNFKKMDIARYPLIELVRKLAPYKGNVGSLLIGANDMAVELFLNGRIRFDEIETYIFKAMKAARFIAHPSVEDLLVSNRWAADFVADSWANNK